MAMLASIHNMCYNRGMESKGRPLTSDEAQEFKQLILPIEQDLARKACASWQVSSRPNPLAEFDQATMPPRADGRKHVPLGHVANMGDFEQTSK